MAIYINDGNRAQVLAALFNNARPQGMGFLSFKPEPMTAAQAAELLKAQTYFDYLQGRVMKVDLGGDSFDERLYDRDNGQGAAWAAVESIVKEVA
jgi:hypothetical protein